MAASRKTFGELELIRTIGRLFADLPARGVTLGIGDDCAILRPPAGSEILVTTDLLLEGRHFRRDLHPAASAGHRCLARGLSDVAAMGASPMAAFLSLALPPGTLAEADSRRWLHGFLRGMRSLARRAPVPLAGGDTGETAGDLLMADIVLLGTAPRGRAMRRSLARPGDLLYVTGHLGGAAAELRDMLQGRGNGPGRRRGPQCFPEPRLAAGIALRELGVRAAIDVSDGLSTDLHHLAAASRVCAVVEAERLPLHPLLRRRANDEVLALALHGGEDYELLFAAAPRLRVPDAIGGVAITRIGRLEPLRSGRPLIGVITPGGRVTALRPAGWQHFTAREHAGFSGKP